MSLSRSLPGRRVRELSQHVPKERSTEKRRRRRNDAAVGRHEVLTAVTAIQCFYPVVSLPCVPLSDVRQSSYDSEVSRDRSDVVETQNEDVRLSIARRLLPSSF